jgi:hypothetical protein
MEKFQKKLNRSIYVIYYSKVGFAQSRFYKEFVGLKTH